MKGFMGRQRYLMGTSFPLLVAFGVLGGGSYYFQIAERGRFCKALASINGKFDTCP